MGLVQRRLVKWVMRVVSYPWITLGVCALVLVAAVGVARLKLTLSTDQNALLTPNLKFFKDYLRFDSQFPENEAFVVIVEPKDYAHPPPAKRWMALADRITANLRALKGDVARVEEKVPLDQLGDQALMFAPWPAVKAQSAEARELLLPFAENVAGRQSLLRAAIMGSDVTHRFYQAMAMTPPAQRAQAKGLVNIVTQSLDAALRTPADQWVSGVQIPDLTDLDPRAATDPSIHGYNMIPDETKRKKPSYETQKLLIINVYQKRDYSSLSDVVLPLQRMRAAVKAAAKGFEDFDAPVITGRPALEADEMATSDHDTRVAEVLGLITVFIALWIFLRRLWLVIVAEICLGVGIGWTFGWATVTIGRLNLLSLVFVIALIGIGMDYLIQILTRYRYEKKRYTRPRAIWARVFRYVSPPVSTACLGAAGAFLVADLTQFKGAAELGVIAGGGLLLLLLAGYTVLPAILTLWPADVGRVEEGERYHDVEKAPHSRWWKLAPGVIWVLLALGGLWLSLPPRFDPNLLKLQAQSLPSVQWVHKLPTWFAAVTTQDLEKLRRARQALTPNPEGGAGSAGPAAKTTTIGATDSILDAMDKQQWLTLHNQDLKAIDWVSPSPPGASDLSAIADAITAMQATWDKSDKALLEDARPNLDALVALLRNPGANGNPTQQETLARLGAWEKAFVGVLKANLAQFTPGPLDLTRLPRSLRDHFVSYRKGVAVPRSEQTATAASMMAASPTYALYVYPREDLWESGNLEAFVKEVEARTPNDAALTLTGIAPQLYHSVQQIHHAFRMSAFYALVLIFVLVLLDLRDIGHTLLAVSVLAFGLPMLLLCMWAWRAMQEPWGIPGNWNFANFFALPILIGAGHEYGVFMVHRYRETLHDPRRIWKFWDVSDRALLLCAIVTSSSFGFLMLAKHRGLASLGWVMAVGTLCIYFATIVILRPILQWRLHRKQVYSALRGEPDADHVDHPPANTPPRT